MNEYEELFPHKNVSKSLEKYLEYDKSPIHTKALSGLKMKRAQTIGVQKVSRW